MPEENKTVELNDEELEQVNGGQILPNDEGYYVFTKGEIYKQLEASYGCNFTILESKSTKNTKDKVYCEIEQALDGIQISYNNVSVSILIDCFKR